MPYERVVLKGTIGGLIETRSIYTASIIYAQGETRPVVWGQYLNPLYAHVIDAIGAAWTADLYDIYYFESGSWVFAEQGGVELAGNAGGDTYNSMIAAVMIGSAPGLRRIGRKFFSPLGEASVTGNTLVVNAVALFASGLAHYITPFETTGGSSFSPGIMDKNNVFRPFTSGVVSSILGTIRRRKQARGI